MNAPQAIGWLNGLKRRYDDTAAGGAPGLVLMGPSDREALDVAVRSLSTLTSADAIAAAAKATETV